MKPIPVAALISGCFWLVADNVMATVTLPPVFGDHMVLQREAVLPVWGRAAPGAMITVEFGGQRNAALADSRGDWRLQLDPLPASNEPRSLRVSGDGTVQFTNVLVGEVWLAAGQSNMEWPLAREAHAAAELPAATNTSLRLLNLSFAGQYFFAKPFGSNELTRMTRERFYAGSWQPCAPALAREFSAVAYYFGRELRQELALPVGVVHLAVGGSPAEAWIRRAALARDRELSALVQGNWLTNRALDDWCRERGQQNLGPAFRSGMAVPGDDLGPNHHFKPGFLWDSGPARLLPFAIRGVLWYQGESNSLEARRVEQHGRLFPLLVRDWRQQWARDDLSFLYCQLSSITTNGGYQASFWPDFRDQQRCFLDVLPHTAMAVTSDLGHPTDVHPRNKLDVGRRLVRAALAGVYGRSLEWSGPLFRDATGAHGKVVVRFAHEEGLRTTDGLAPNGFELAADDGVFKPAMAIIEHDAVVLTCPEVTLPSQIRYAWKPFPVPIQNLINAARLPASTFKARVSPAQ